MKFHRAAVVVAALAFAVVGCQNNSAPTTGSAPATAPDRNKTNIHIEGPRGGKVDVHGNGNNGNTNVDIRRGTGR